MTDDQTPHYTLLDRLKGKPGRPPVDKSRPRDVTAAEFNEWQQRHGFNASECARRLGVSVNTIPAYLNDGAPGRVGLAMLAIDLGLLEYSADNSAMAQTAKRLLKALG